jgi:phage tail tape-measure protein
MYAAFVQASPGVNEFDGGRKMLLGAAGSLAGAGAGALLGSVVPVAGTTMGAAAGAAVGGAASDLTKETLGWLTDNSPDGASTEMYQRIRKLEAELEAMKRWEEYGGGTQGVGSSRGE